MYIINHFVNTCVQKNYIKYVTIAPVIYQSGRLNGYYSKHSWFLFYCY